MHTFHLQIRSMSRPGEWNLDGDAETLLRFAVISPCLCVPDIVNQRTHWEFLMLLVSDYYWWEKWNLLLLHRKVRKLVSRFCHGPSHHFNLGQVTWSFSISNRRQVQVATGIWWVVSSGYCRKRGQSSGSVGYRNQNTTIKTVQNPMKEYPSYTSATSPSSINNVYL